ncbi:MAG: tetratricopeptide repeat protein, partial [Planctomycetales bacterium]|nr:tetratricopeptide repeat protein [Planctomycetales bacterium]
ALLLRGICTEALDGTTAAEESFTTCISAWPACHLGYFYRGVTRQTIHRYADAEADYSKVISLRPDLGIAYLNRGMVRVALGDVDAALEDFTTAMAKGRDDSLSYFWRARAHALLEHPDLAAQDTLTAMQRDAVDDEGWFQRGTLKMDAAPEEAAEDFRRALRCNPRNSKAMRNLVAVLADHLNRLDDAIQLQLEFVRIAPDNLLARASLALLYARAGQRELAIEHINAVAENEPHPEIYYQAACCWASLLPSVEGDQENALKWFRAAVSLNPKLIQRADSDPDLASIRTLPDYARIKENADGLLNP